MRRVSNEEMSAWLLSKYDDTEIEHDIIANIITERFQLISAVINLMLSTENTKVIFDQDELQIAAKYTLTAQISADGRSVAFILNENPAPTPTIGTLPNDRT